MPLTVQWDNEEKTIIRWEVEGRWTMVEFLARNQDAQAMMSTVEHPVGVIIDASKSTHMPPDFRSNLDQLSAIGHPNGLGDMWIIGVRGPLLVIGHVYQRLFGQVKFAYSLDEARADIEKVRAKRLAKEAEANQQR